MAQIALNEEFQLFYFVHTKKMVDKISKSLKDRRFDFSVSQSEAYWRLVVNVRASTATGVWDIFFRCGAFKKAKEFVGKAGV